MASLPDLDFKLIKWIRLPSPAEMVSASTDDNLVVIIKVHMRKLNNINFLIFVFFIVYHTFLYHFYEPSF